MGPKYEIVPFLVGKLHLCTFFHDTGLYMPTPSGSYLYMPPTLFVNWLNNDNEPDLWFRQCVYLSVTKVKVIVFLVYADPRKIPKASIYVSRTGKLRFTSNSISRSGTGLGAG